MFNSNNFGTEKWGQKWGQAPILGSFFSVPFFSRMEKTQQDCPVSAQGEARGQIISFSGYMYKYFTFLHYLSFIEDRVKSNTGIRATFLLAHLLH
jgi:hypothetical protein